MSVLSSILESDSPSLVRHSVLGPAAGPLVPVAAAVYNSNTATERYRINKNAPVIEPDEQGFLFKRTGRTGASVVISSVAAEASRTEPEIYRDPDFYPLLTALEITAPSREVLENIAEKVTNGKNVAFRGLDSHLVAALDGVTKSSWEVSHRHVDSWFRYALTPDTGKSVWAETDGDLYKHIISNEPATIAKISLNSLIWGYWLNGGGSRTSRRARTLSSQIIGVGASPVPVYGTKGDSGFPLRNEKEWRVEGGELILAAQDAERESGAKGSRHTYAKASELALGAVPVKETQAPLHFTCEMIAGLTSVSLTDLRALKRHGLSDELVRACLGISILATEIGAENLHVRSECDLVEEAEPVWGLRRRGRARAVPQRFNLDTVREETLDSLRAALVKDHLGADESGTEEPRARKISLTMNDASVRAVMQDRAENMAKTVDKEG